MSEICPIGSCVEAVPCPKHDSSWVKSGGSRGFSGTDRREIFERDRWTCQSCGHVDRSGRSLEADHIVSVAFGGSGSVANGQTLCRSCHRRKSAGEAARARHRVRARRVPERHP